MNHEWMYLPGLAGVVLSWAGSVIFFRGTQNVKIVNYLFSRVRIEGLG